VLKPRRIKTVTYAATLIAIPSSTSRNILQLFKGIFSLSSKLEFFLRINHSLPDHL